MSIFPFVCRRAFVLAVFLTAAVVARAAHSLPPNFPAAIQLPASARGEAAISALGKRLPEVAAFYRQTPEELAARFRTDDSLWADAQGQLYYVCDFLVDTNAAAPASVESIIGPTDPPPFPASDTFLLHSFPGANRVIYLDFTGHADTSGKWKAGAAEPPFDLDGNTNSFSTTERDRIVYIWQRVAEDYSMYKIDVTTEDPGIEALRKTNAADQNYGVRVVIGGSSSDWYGSGAGGVAFVGSFDDSTDTPCWVFPKSLGNSEKNIAEAASHEAGHTLGLSHDGTSTKGYYSGQGNWAPIMGVGYSKPIVQWSKGEYTDANQLQDDLSVMTNNGAVYRTDDHGNTTATATVLTTGSTNGVIERNTDLDFFRFTASGGSVTITVSRPPRDSNLHMQVILYDSGGVPILTNTPADSSTSGTQSAVNTLTLAAGNYYVSVAGAGNGDPLTTGYSDYASLGQYDIAVTGAAAAGPVWVPTAAGTYSWTNLPNWTATPPNANGVTALVNNNIAGNQIINVPGVVTLGTLVLGDLNSSHTFTLQSTNSGSFTLTNGASSAFVNRTSGSNDVINLPVTLAGNLTINHTAGSPLTFANAISGAGALTKSGAGTTVLAGTNSYAGSTTLSDGVLRLNRTNALPSGNLVIVGGVIGLGAGDFTDRTVGTGAGQVQWNGDGGFAAYGAERTVKFSASSINWSATDFIGNSTALVLGAADADATLNWQQAISLAGAARVIQVEAGSAAIDAKMTANIAGGSAGSYASHFTKSGSGTLALTIQPTYYGDTTVAEGTLMLGDGTGNTGGVSQNTTNISITAGAALAVNRTGTLTQGSDALPVIISGEGDFSQVGSGTTVFTLANDYSGLTSISAGTLQVGDGTAANGTVAGDILNNAAFVVANPFAQTYGGRISGTGNFTKTGAGTLTLTNAQTFTGGAAVSNGILQLLRPGLISNSVVTVSANGTLLFNNNGANWGTTLINPPINLTGGTLTNYASANHYTVFNNLTNGAVTVQAASTIGVYQTTTGSGGFYLDGGLKGSAPLTVNAGGAAAGLSLRSTNSTYSGILTVNGVASTNLGVGSGLTLGSTGAQSPNLTNVCNLPNATIIVNGTMGLGVCAGDMSWAAANASGLPVSGLSGTTFQMDALGGTGVVVAHFTSTGTRTLSLGNNNGSGIFSGIIANGTNSALRLIKNGSGTQTLSGPNSYTGPTTINGGTLLVNNPSGSGTGSGGVAINTGSTLGGTGTIAGAVTNNAGGTLAPGTNGPGTLTISGNLRLNAGSTNVFEVNVTTLAKDMVNLGAAVTYGGELKIIPAGTFTAGQSFTLFSGTGATNASNFASISGSPGAGLSFTFTNGVLRVVSTVLPRPTLGVALSSPTNLVISFPTVVGGTYVLQSATNLNPVIFWQNESTNAGTGGTLLLNVGLPPGDPRKFFRVWIY